MPFAARSLMRSPNICISPAAYLLAAAAILLLPIPLFLSGVLAAAFHEFAHCLALSFFQIPIQEIRIGPLGARICVGAMDPWQELACAAAGPMGSLSLLLLAKQLPLLALFGFVQGIFNLLPIYPMDGGRILLASMNLWREYRDRF